MFINNNGLSDKKSINIKKAQYKTENFVSGSPQFT